MLENARYEFRSRSGALLETSRGKGDRLESWKEVALFFRRGVRTVQLWEKSEGLPIRRHHHNRLATVYAHRPELEAWWQARGMLIESRSEVELGTTQRSSGQPASLPQKNGDLRIAIQPFSWIGPGSDLRELAREFAEGLREELLIELRRVKVNGAQEDSGLRPCFVAAAGEGSSYLQSPDAVLSGSLRAHGTEVRLCVQLSRKWDGAVVWTDRFDIGLSDLRYGQTGVAANIADAIPLDSLCFSWVGEGMPSSSSSTMMVGPAHDDPSMQMCRLGRYLWNQKSHQGLMKAVEYFRRAVELDPSCDSAYAGLADCYLSMAYHQYLTPDEARAKGYPAALSAVRLNRNSSTAHTSLAHIMTYLKWDWAAAEKECRLAGEQDPANAFCLSVYSTLLSIQGRHEEAIKLALQSQRLEPLSQVSNTTLGRSYYYDGHYAEAVELFRQTVSLNPELVLGHQLLGLASVALGDQDRAISSLSDAVALSQNSSTTLSMLAFAHAMFKETATAKSMLAEIEASRSPGLFPCLDVAAVYVALGDHAHALQLLRRAYHARDTRMVFLKCDPRFDKLHGSAAFDRLTADMRLP
jgi:tetratricopeptide (TPR) repeat protein/TolB-like protein